MSTYAKEYRGNDTDTIKLFPKPVLDFDQPRIRRKNITDIYNLPQWGKFAYFLSHEAGTLKFRFSESLIDHREPFSIQNLVYVSYVSGHNTIPDEVKKAVIEMIKYRLSDNEDLKSMKGGSGSFEFLSPTERLQRILVPIMNYKMRPK